MAEPVFDPTLPAPCSMIRSEELRNNFNALKEQVDEQGEQIAHRALKPFGVEPLDLPISNPPTQAEVQTVCNRFNQLLTALNL